MSDFQQLRKKIQQKKQKASQQPPAASQPIQSEPTSKQVLLDVPHTYNLRPRKQSAHKIDLSAHKEKEKHEEKEKEKNKDDDDLKFFLARINKKKQNESKQKEGAPTKDQQKVQSSIVEEENNRKGQKVSEPLKQDNDIQALEPVVNEKLNANDNNDEGNNQNKGQIFKHYQHQNINSQTPLSYNFEGNLNSVYNDQNLQQQNYREEQRQQENRQQQLMEVEQNRQEQQQQQQLELEQKQQQQLEVEQEQEQQQQQAQQEEEQQFHRQQPNDVDNKQIMEVEEPIVDGVQNNLPEQSDQKQQQQQQQQGSHESSKSQINQGSQNNYNSFILSKMKQYEQNGWSIPKISREANEKSLISSRLQRLMCELSTLVKGYDIVEGELGYLDAVRVLEELVEGGSQRAKQFRA